MTLSVNRMRMVQVDLHPSNHKKFDGRLKEVLLVPHFGDRLLSELKLEKDSFSIVWKND